MNKILFIVHDYPPIRTAGTERALRFAQFLPDFGFSTLILTTNRYGGTPADPESDVFRANDLIHDLFKPIRKHKTAEVPQDAQVKVPTIPNQSFFGRLRDQLLIPDTKIGWAPAAIRLGNQICADYRPDLIFSSSPPETAHLIALSLSRQAGLPWIADLRDGWIFEPPNVNVRSARWRLFLERYLEQKVVDNASAVVTATEPITQDLKHRYPQHRRKVTTVYNGFVEAEFCDLHRKERPNDRTTIVYTGSLSASRQGTSADAFFTALAIYARRNSKSDILVHIIGNVTDAEKKIAEATGIAEIVRFVPPVSRKEAHQHQIDADVLLLITAPNQRSVATLKLFEYIRAGVPILALAENNAAADIVQQYNLGLTVAPDNPLAIADALHEIVQQVRLGRTWPGFAVAQERFNRRRLTEELADVFHSVLEHWAKEPSR